MAWEWGAQVLEMQELSREAISHKPLAISPERGELVISVGKQRGEEVVIVGDWFVEGLSYEIGGCSRA